jgi:hypothetical protein
MKASLVVGAALVTFILAGTPSSQAMPAGPISKSVQQGSSTLLDTVHWRRWRHCHWRAGWRRCHGYRGYRRYGYGHYGYRWGGPSIVLGFGGHRHRGWRRGRW